MGVGHRVFSAMITDFFSSHRRANTGLNHVVRVSNHMKKKVSCDMEDLEIAVPNWHVLQVAEGKWWTLQSLAGRTVKRP